MPESYWIIHFWMTLTAGRESTSVGRSKAGETEQTSWSYISVEYKVDRNAEEPLGQNFWITQRTMKLMSAGKGKVGLRK